MGVVLKGLSRPSCVCLHLWGPPRTPAAYSPPHFHSDILKQETLKPGGAPGTRSPDTWSFSLVQETMPLPPAGHHDAEGTALQQRGSRGRGPHEAHQSVPARPAQSALSRRVLPSSSTRYRALLSAACSPHDFSISIQVFPLQGSLPNGSLVFSPQLLLHRPQPSLLR